MHSATVNAKPDDATGELVHHHENPIGPQCGRFATEQIAAPQTVLRVAQKRKPGRTARTRFWAVVNAQESPHHILVNLDAESQRDLLSDAWAAPPGITPLHGNHGIDAVLVRSLRTRPMSAFGSKQDAVPSFAQQAVE